MPKGVTNNPNGRPKGVPNRVTADMRLILKCIVSDELDHLPEYIQELKHEQRTELLLKLLPYVMPKVGGVYWKEGDSALDRFE